MKEEIIKLRKLGIPVSALAAKFNRSKSFIYKALRGLTFDVAHPKYNTALIQHEYFSEENLLLFPERYVLIGFIAADGCIYEKYRQLCFNLSNKDVDCINMINQELSLSSRTLTNIAKTNSIFVSFTSKKILLDLEKFHIKPRKTNSLRLPDISIECMKYYLRGFFYGDGCIQNGKRKLINLSGNKDIIDDIEHFLLSNKIVNHSISYFKRSSDTTKLLFLQGNNAVTFCDFIFNDEKMILIKRKHIHFTYEIGQYSLLRK